MGGTCTWEGTTRVGWSSSSSDEEDADDEDEDEDEDEDDDECEERVDAMWAADEVEDDETRWGAYTDAMVVVGRFSVAVALVESRRMDDDAVLVGAIAIPNAMW
jgi:hypothetical protein